MGFAQRGADLQQQRERLRLRSTELRLQLAVGAQVLQGPLAVVDEVRSVAHWARTHPEWPLGILAALLVAKPRRAVSWSAKLWWGWRLWRRARRMLGDLPAARR
jgi:hypothetical protein